MNWLATFFYMLATVETFVVVLAFSKLMSLPVSAGRTVVLSLSWPVLPVLFLYKVAFNK